MQSSYSLIKSNGAILSGGKSIETRHPNLKEEIEYTDIEKDQEIKKQQEIQKSYEIIGNNIINKAKSDSQKILVIAGENAKRVEKEAYETGYQQGKSNGYEDGYSEGYSKAIADGNEKANVIIEDANKMLAEALSQYENYMQDKKEQIINLAFEMAKVMAKTEFKKSHSILSLLEPIMQECKGEENLVIRCNKCYIETIEERIYYWKNAYSIKGEIFVLGDPLMEEGNATIEKKTGKVIVGMDIALGKLEEVIREQYVGGIND